MLAIAFFFFQGAAGSLSSAGVGARGAGVGGAVNDGAHLGSSAARRTVASSGAVPPAVQHLPRAPSGTGSVSATRH